MENYYTTEQVAEILSVPKSTIHYWLSRGYKNIPQPQKIGRRNYWDKAEFTAWFMENGINLRTKDVVPLMDAMTQVVNDITNDKDLRTSVTSLRNAADDLVKDM